MGRKVRPVLRFNIPPTGFEHNRMYCFSALTDNESWERSRLAYPLRQGVVLV